MLSITRNQLTVSIVTAAVIATLVVPGLVAGATTTVSLNPADQTLVQGERTTVDVVVENADDGVGAYAATITISDRDVVQIADVAVEGSPDLTDVSVSDDGSRATVKAALMNANGEDAVVATVTIEGATVGTTGVSVAVDALGDREGNSYQVAGTTDATLSVVGTTTSGASVTQTRSNGANDDQQATRESPAGSTGTTESTEQDGSADDRQSRTDTQPGREDAVAGGDDASAGGDDTSAGGDDPSAGGDRAVTQSQPTTLTAPVAAVAIAIAIGVVVLLGLLVARRR